MVNLTIRVIGDDLVGEPRHVTGLAFVRSHKEWAPMKPGEVVAFEDEEAREVLKKMGRALEITLEEPNRVSPPSLTGVAVSIEEIVATIERMNGDNTSLWTDAGLPRVNAIEEMLGKDITSEMRDDAWDKFQG